MQSDRRPSAASDTHRRTERTNAGAAHRSFDLAWSLESGEHMPDKEAWLNEVTRILKPNGTFVCVTWCHRETDQAPLTLAEIRHLGRICYNYHLPEWVPLSHYVEVCAKTGLTVHDTGDWTASIMPFWPAVIRSALRPMVLLQLLFCTSWATIKGAPPPLALAHGVFKALRRRTGLAPDAA